MSAVVVAGGRFDRHVEVSAAFVEREWGPGAGVARVLGGALFPRVVPELAACRDGVEAPAQGTGAGINGEDAPGHVAVGRRPCAHLQSRTDDDKVAEDKWRGTVPD